MFKQNNYEVFNLVESCDATFRLSDATRTYSHVEIKNGG